MKDRYLFLDIDGVLNTLDYAKACQWKDGKVRDEYGALFDPYTVENLKYILDSVPVKLVISSSWRIGLPRYTSFTCHPWRSDSQKAMPQ